MLRSVWLMWLCLATWSVTSVFAQTSGAPRMLVVDYAMAYPEENAGAMSLFTEAGFVVHYRQYYPGLVEKDAVDYDAILLMGGGDPGMSMQEVDLAISFVGSGKLIILAIPPDAGYGGKVRAGPDLHDRYLFNLLLTRLNIRLYAFAPPNAQGPAFMPAIGYEAPSGHPAFQGLAMPVYARAATRLLVGTGVEPLLVEPETEKAPPVVSEVKEDERKFRKRRERIRVQPSETRPDEEVDVLMRGPQTLRPYLHYAARPPAPVVWSATEFKGEVVSVVGDTITIRMSGNRWGSDYAIVQVPGALIATLFVEREFTEEIVGDAENTAGEAVPTEETGRLAAAAVGHTDRLNRGFVMAIDRELLNTLSGPGAPIGWDVRVDRARISTFLTGFGRYARTLTSRSADWNPVNPYPVARIPGQQEPRFPINRIPIAPTLPERVTVTTHTTRPSDFDIPNTVNETHPPIHGVEDYIVRTETRTDSLIALLPSLGINLLWTAAPAASFSLSDTTRRQETVLNAWGPDIGRRLAGSGIQWYAGITVPVWQEGQENRYASAINAQGHPVAMPARFDIGYWKDQLFDPARAIARFSRAAPALNGVVVEWDTHLPRAPWSYASTDAFEDEIFQQYIRYVAGHGLYRGDAFKHLQKLEKNQRFEWLMKAGRLEEYFEMLESRSEQLGRLFRDAIGAIQPAMRYGSFMRRPCLSWFHIGFWRGVSNPEQPHILLTYEQAPDWYVDFLRKRGVAVRTVPIALFGLLDRDHLKTALQDAAARGGYCLERGAWLVDEPPAPKDWTAPPDGLTGSQIIDLLKNR